MNTKEINPKNYLTKLQRNLYKEDSFIIPIEVYDYQSLAGTIQNIANLSINYLHSIENSFITDYSLYEIVNLLEIQKQLLPVDEMELLDKLNK